jgi:beta-lactam-binding protein with PASTA domain
VVPRVIGLSLGRAKKKIRTAHCRVGRVTRRSTSRHPGRVIGQRPRPGTIKPAGFRVNLVVGRR